MLHKAIATPHGYYKPMVFLTANCDITQRCPLHGVQLKKYCWNLTPASADWGWLCVEEPGRLLSSVIEGVHTKTWWMILPYSLLRSNCFQTPANGSDLCSLSQTLQLRRYVFSVKEWLLRISWKLCTQNLKTYKKNIQYMFFECPGMKTFAGETKLGQ